MNPEPVSLSSPRSRNPWPWAIVGFFILFLAWTIGFVLFSLRQPVDLVRADYYTEELRHQEDIRRHARALPFHGQVAATYNPVDRQITIALPPEHARASGSIHLYRPSAARLDRHVPLALNASGQQRLAAGELSPGLWRVRLTWAVGGQQYAFDQDVVIGPRPSPEQPLRPGAH